ncbi:MAG TPA: hypothetical protein VM925_33155, partial [Labilithrix sp.]|nr:hypothetical protein [Labilithrix sp.]
LEDGQKRGLERIGPPSAVGKAPKEAPVTPAVVSPVVQSQSQPQPKRPNPCDPPYTVDPATGRRTYKRDCL